MPWPSARHAYSVSSLCLLQKKDKEKETKERKKALLGVEKKGLAKLVRRRRSSSSSLRYYKLWRNRESD